MPNGLSDSGFADLATILCPLLLGLGLGVVGTLAGLAISTGTSTLTAISSTLINAVLGSSASLGGDLLGGGAGLLTDLGGSGMGLIEDFLGTLGNSAGSIGDALTMDLFDFDQSGGNAPLAGIGGNLGSNPGGATPVTAATEAQKAIMAWVLAHLGKTFKVKLPSGKEKTYVIQGPKRGSRGRRAGKDISQDRTIAELKGMIRGMASK